MMWPFSTHKDLYGKIEALRIKVRCLEGHHAWEAGYFYGDTLMIKCRDCYKAPPESKQSNVRPTSEEK